MEPRPVRFVLPPQEQANRRALLALADALRAARPELEVETPELLALPSVGRMPGGCAVVVAERPVPLPPDALGLALVLSWAPGAVWTRAEAQAYALPHEALIPSLEAQGVPARLAEITGLPVLPPPLDRAAARARLALPGDEKTVFAVLLEGLDPAQLGPLLFQLTLIERPCTFVFFGGGDAGTRSYLRREVPVHGLDARLLSDPRHLPNLLAAADLALCSSDGLPSGEALAAGLPCLVLPGQSPEGEEAARFLGLHKAARRVADPRTLATEAELLLRDPDARTALRSAGAALLRPEGLASCLSLLLRMVEDPAGFRERAQEPRPAAAPAPAGLLEAPPLEDLGGGGWEPPAPASAAPLASPAASPVQGRRASVEALTELIAAEKATRTRYEQASADLERWKARAALAADAADSELRVLALREARQAEARMAQLAEDLERLARRRTSERRPAASGGGMEERFRRLELDAQLRRLKERLES